MSYEFEPACRRMEWLDPFYKAVWEKAFADAIPISGTFELTPRCNFDCRMCYVHLKEKEIPQYGRELTAKEWIHIAEEARKAGTTWLCITGGEPLMHPEFETIWKELCKMGFFITLQTNASLIRGRIAELFDKYPPRNVKTTIYGSNDETYERVCRVKNGFTRVNEGIQKLRELKIPVEAVSIVIEQNRADVQRIAFYAFQNKIRWQPTAGVKLSVRRKADDICQVRLADPNKEIWKQQMKERLEKHPIDINRKPCTYCKDYRLGYWITWNGQMRFCSFMDRPDIPVLENGFIDSWKQLIEYEESLKWPEECYTCEANKICLKCAGTLNAECGGPEKVTEEFCRKYKEFMEDNKEVQ